MSVKPCKLCGDPLNDGGKARLKYHPDCAIEAHRLASRSSSQRQRCRKKRERTNMGEPEYWNTKSRFWMTLPEAGFVLRANMLLAYVSKYDRMPEFVMPSMRI